MTDSCAWLVIGSDRGLGGNSRARHRSQCLLRRLWLQMTSKSQDGSACILDILASLLYSGRKWRHVIHLYIQSWFRQVQIKPPLGDAKTLLNELKSLRQDTIISFGTLHILIWSILNIKNINYHIVALTIPLEDGALASRQ